MKPRQDPPDSGPLHRIVLDVWSILRESFVRFWQDDCPFFAAGIAFYSLFSIFSLLLLLSLILGLVFGRNPQNLDFLTTFMEGIGPAAASEFVRDQGERILHDVGTVVAQPGPGLLLPLAMVALLWTSSNVFQAYIHALCRIYHLGETRSAWRSRLMALGLALGGALLMVVSFVLFVFGGDLNEGLDQFQWIQGHLVQWILIYKRPLAVGGVFLSSLLLYWLAPKFNQAHRTAWPGALVFTVLWFLVTEGFKIYLREVAVFDKIYGNATTLIIMILWVQISAQLTLYGGEVNAAIHRMRRDRALERDPGIAPPH